MHPQEFKMFRQTFFLIKKLQKLEVGKANPPMFSKSCKKLQDILQKMLKKHHATCADQISGRQSSLSSNYNQSAVNNQMNNSFRSKLSTISGAHYQSSQLTPDKNKRKIIA